MKKLDKFEEDVLESVEAGEWKSKDDLDVRLGELQTIVKKQKKRQRLIHQFAVNKIKLNV